MSIISVPGREANKSPKPLTFTGNELQREVLPLGVFFKCQLRPEGHGDPQETEATPLVMILLVSWIAEPGIIYCDGRVAGAGEAYAHFTKTDRYSRDTRLNTSSFVFPAAVDKAIGKTKFSFTELEDVYHVAVRRAVAITDETARKYRGLLVADHAPYVDGFKGEGQFFTPTETEDEMNSIISRYLKNPS